MTKGKLTVLGWSVTILVLAAIVTAFLVVGSPMQARLRKADDQRLSDILAISNRVDDFYSEHRRLPTDYDELSRALNAYDSGTDPLTNKPYEYHVVKGSIYTLTASYSTDTRTGRARSWVGTKEIPARHPKGDVTYTLDARPKRDRSEDADESTTKAAVGSTLG